MAAKPGAKIQNTKNSKRYIFLNPIIINYPIIHEKVREILFMLKLHSVELLSFWQDFSKKIEN